MDAYTRAYMELYDGNYIRRNYKTVRRLYGRHYTASTPSLYW